MEWGGGVIGWQASSSKYASHSLSGRSDSNIVGCLYSSNFSAVLYNLDNCKYTYIHDIQFLFQYKHNNMYSQ